MQRSNTTKIFLISCIVVLIQIKVSAESKIDSLLRVFHNSDSETKISVANKIIRINYNLGEYKTSSKILTECDEILHLLSDSSIAKLNRSKGTYHFQKEESEKSLYYTKEALKYYEQENSVKNIILQNTNIGAILAQKGEITESVRYFIKSILKSEDANKYYEAAVAYHNIAHIYTKYQYFTYISL